MLQTVFEHRLFSKAELLYVMNHYPYITNYCQSRSAVNRTRYHLNTIQTGYITMAYLFNTLFQTNYIIYKIKLLYYDDDDTVFLWIV